MQLTISSVDCAPEELYDQLPIVADLIRQLPGDDRPDYWLAKTQRPIRWIKDNIEHSVGHLVLTARRAATQIQAGVERLPVGIAYVTDETLLNDTRLEFRKCTYVAIGISTETSGAKRFRPLTHIFKGRIWRAFGADRLP